jgi:hypothetical protein
MKLRGDGINVNRYRVSKDDDSKVHLYVDVRGKYTLRELVNFVIDHGGLLDNTTFTGGCFVITEPSTPDDRRKWQEADEKQQANALRWRREQYERLKAEFEPEES